MTELTRYLPKEVRQETGGYSMMNQWMAALINAPDGIDPQGVAGYEELRSWGNTGELIDQLAKADRFDTAVAVLSDERPVTPLGPDGDAPSLPSNMEKAFILTKLAVLAYAIPARQQWAREHAEEAGRIAVMIGSPSARENFRTRSEDTADRARALAAVTAYPGWPEETALATFRGALELTRGWSRYTFFRVLTEAVPYLARLGDEILAHAVQQIIEVDTWWTRHPEYS